MDIDDLKILEQIEAKAFKKGVAATVQAVRQALESIEGQAPPARMKTARTGKKLSPENPFRPDTASSAIYTYIKKNPGLRGAEIIKNTNLEAKNVRTVLHRLKKRGYAIVEDGTWRIL